MVVQDMDLRNKNRQRRRALKKAMAKRGRREGKLKYKRRGVSSILTSSLSLLLMRGSHGPRRNQSVLGGGGPRGYDKARIARRFASMGREATGASKRFFYSGFLPIHTERRRPSRKYR